MKYTKEILTIIVLITVFTLSGCDRSSNEMDNIETSEITSSDLKEEIQEYRTEMSEQYKEFNIKTSRLEQQIENEPDEEVRDRLETKLNDYEETQRELNHELDNYQVSESDNWDEFKNNFSDRMDELDDSLNNFFSTTNTKN